MNGFDYWKQAFQKYTVFEGRARRSEYWYFGLFNTLFYLLLVVIFPPLAILYALATIIPNLAVSVRRMHDVGKSGWMIFITLIPLIGQIWFLILTLTEGDRHSNAYGPDPKNPVVDDVIDHMVD